MEEEDEEHSFDIWLSRHNTDMKQFYTSNIDFALATFRDRFAGESSETNQTPPEIVPEISHEEPPEPTEDTEVEKRKKFKGKANAFWTSRKGEHCYFGKTSTVLRQYAGKSTNFKSPDDAMQMKLHDGNIHILAQAESRAEDVRCMALFTPIGSEYGTRKKHVKSKAWQKLLEQNCVSTDETDISGRLEKKEVSTSLQLKRRREYGHDSGSSSEEE